MPRIPKMIKTKFPSQAYMQTKGPRVGSIHRFRYEPGRNGYIHLMKGPDNLWWETEYEPLQGPELPRDIEKYRQQMIDAIESDNTRRELSRRRAYEEAWAKEMARQAYNRRVATWNSYRKLPPRERAFIANQNRLRETLYDYMPSWEAEQYTRNYPNYEAMPPVEMVPGDKRTLDLDELKGFESFDELPDNGLVDMPWNRWK